MADRLQQSLHNAILIRLDMAEQRRQVSRPWDADLRTANQAPQPLAPGTPIANVFDRDDVGGKLLVLGNPGAGKTTTMLDLAATLIQRANADPEAPIPIMVNLSSWQNPRQSCTGWLLQELKSKYGVSPKLGQTWLTQKKLLPLLDGLDELPPARQEPVVKALNAWLASDNGPPHLLVCSRLEEYELYTVNLELNAAICLHPLTDEQVQAYLASLKMTPLWHTLQHDADLLELVRTPLLLSVSILANDEIDLLQWQRLKNTHDRLDYLLDAYIVRRLHESVKSKTYSPGKAPTGKQTRRWLVWLAKQLKAQSDDEFLIEKMQPSMLKSNLGIAVYLTVALSIIVVISGLILGFFLGLISIRGDDRVILFIATTVVIPITAIPIGILIGLTTASILKIRKKLIFGLGQIDFVETLDPRLSRYGLILFLRELLLTCWISALLGVFFGAIVGVLSGIILEAAIVGFLIGLSFGIVPGFFSGIIAGLKRDISNSQRPNDGIYRSLRSARILFYLMFFIVCILRLLLFLLLPTGSEQSELIDIILIFVLMLMVITIFSKTISPCIQHLALRYALFMTNAIPWNYARFLNHCTERLLLQRVGGRYRFIHRLIQERFAAMPLER